MYDDRELLGQYGDFSGYWTREQLDLIRKQGLRNKTVQVRREPALALPRGFDALLSHSDLGR